MGSGRQGEVKMTSRLQTYQAVPLALMEQLGCGVLGSQTTGNRERHSEATSHCALGQSIPWAVERWAADIERAKRELDLL